ncbi:hypothetical protein, partial [Streptomyces sp. CO7]
RPWAQLPCLRPTVVPKPDHRQPVRPPFQSLIAVPDSDRRVWGRLPRLDPAAFPAPDHRP